MLLRQMRYFTAVVDCGSFTEAAEQCFISQSAISQQISALEKELGATLIRRESRKVSLTPAGEYFYRHSLSLLEEAEKLRRETVHIASGEELHLRIGYLQFYSGQELRQTIASFSKIYPEVKISLVNGTHEELYHMIMDGDIDLSLNDQRRAFNEEYVNFHLLYCDCYAEFSAQNPLGEQSRVTPEDLSELSCILVSSKEQQENEREFYQKMIGLGSNFIFAENLDEARLMAIGNRGFIPIEAVGTMPPLDGALRRVPLYRGGRRIQRNYCAFWPRDKSNYYIEEFADMLRSFLRQDEKKNS